MVTMQGVLKDNIITLKKKPSLKSKNGRVKVFILIENDKTPKIRTFNLGVNPKSLERERIYAGR